MSVQTTLPCPDLSDVVDVLRPTDTVATVYIGPQSAGAPGIGWDARWHALARRLRSDGADTVMVEDLERAVLRESPVLAAVGMAELVAFGAEGRVPRVFHAPGLAHRDFARFATPAHVLPVLGWLQDRPPCVVVATDRAGADLHIVAGGGRTPQSWSVQGLDDEIERNAPGGWAQLRYQHRAEDSWRHNASTVAQACEAALRPVNARLLVISGDERAAQLLHEQLSTRTRDTVTIRHITGGRNADSSGSTRSEKVVEVARSTARQWTTDILSCFAEQRSAAGLAVSGDHATLDALAQGRIAMLLVENSMRGGRTAWFGAKPTDVMPGDRTPASWPQRHSGTLFDVAVRAALLTGAQVRVLEPGMPGSPTGGIGGLCRFC